MPSIEILQPAHPAETPQEWPDQWDYPSPDGTWKVTYLNPTEFRMGADAWAIQLIHKGQDVLSQYPTLSGMSEGPGFRDPTQSPWCSDNDYLALQTWRDKGEVILY